MCAINQLLIFIWPLYTTLFSKFNLHDLEKHISHFTYFFLLSSIFHENFTRCQSSGFLFGFPKKKQTKLHYLVTIRKCCFFNMKMFNLPVSDLSLRNNAGWLDQFPGIPTVVINFCRFMVRTPRHIWRRLSSRRLLVCESQFTHKIFLKSKTNEANIKTSIKLQRKQINKSK